MLDLPHAVTTTDTTQQPFASDPPDGHQCPWCLSLGPGSQTASRSYPLDSGLAAVDLPGTEYPTYQKARWGYSHAVYTYAIILDLIQVRSVVSGQGLIIILWSYCQSYLLP